MKNSALVFLAAVACVFVGAFAEDIGKLVMPDAEASPGLAVELAQEVPTLNTAGDRVYASAQVDDATGVVTTIAAAGTYVTVGTAAPLASSETDGSGCVTYALATNKFTIGGTGALRCGTGIYRLTACLNNVIGANSAVVLGAWHRVRSGSTTIVGPKLKSTQLATAAQNPLGCIVATVDASLADTYDFRFDSGTNADTVTTRAANFFVEKIRNK